VTGEARIGLHVGQGRWMSAWQLVISALSIVGAVMARVDVGWITLFLGGLLAANTACYIRFHSRSRVSVLQLQNDGHAIVYTATRCVHAWQLEGGWASRWCCVVPLRVIGTGRRLHCLVCRSRNAPDAYRRLLVCLRLNHGANAVRRAVQA
jgi:hypothetical protein